LFPPIFYRVLNLNLNLDESDENEDEEENQNQHFVTASTTQILDPPTVTSTPNADQSSVRHTTALFQDVEDEFLHDGSFAQEAVKAKEMITKEADADSAISSSKDLVQQPSIE
jgi:hypothetical protein